MRKTVSVNIVATLTTLLFLTTSCSSHYIISKQDLQCIKKSPVLLEINNKEKLVEFQKVTVYNQNGEEKTYTYIPSHFHQPPELPEAKDPNQPLQFFLDENVVGGSLKSKSNPGARRGALLGALITGGICFGLVAIPKDYGTAPIHFLSAFSGALFGAGLGALIGGNAKKYHGPAKVVDCPSNQNSQGRK